MCAFIVNPPIRDDADYYRRDDQVVDDVLAGRGKLVVGLRRSGKTSFLYRVQRAAKARALPCRYLELADCADEEVAGLEALYPAPAGAAPEVILLDEAEVWRDWDEARLERLLRAIRACTVVLTCAPQFLLELDREHERVQRFVERLERHVIGPLSDDEARDLLAHAKRPPPGPLGEAAVSDLLRRTERLAILLQALGAERAGDAELAVSLGGFGRRVLTGLTDAARAILVDAAHGRPIAAGTAGAEGPEVGLLVKTGALRRTAGGGVAIASELLGELVRKASGGAVIAAGGGAPAGAIAPPAPVWTRHARILHLSDLHFGRQAIDAPDVQARRLIEALVRDDRVPDFVAVTGDLSWQGHPRELLDAEIFLERVVAWLGARQGWDDAETRRRIAIVPGNHEASWALSRGIGAPGGPPTEEDLEHWVRYSLGPFANFANRFYRRMVWDLDDPCLAIAFEEPSVAFVAMSTAHYITEAARDAKFGRQVLERAARLLEREDVRRARFRVGLWHHNLRPFQSQPGAISDVDVAVRGFLRGKPALDLALHGHVHQGEVEVFRPRGSDQVLAYSAVGSFGVASHHRPGDDLRGRVHNELAIVELRTSGVGRQMQTEFYELKPDADMVWVWRHAATSRAWDL